MHYRNKMRERFTTWIEVGCPDVAVVEGDYEEHNVPADEMRCEMIHCSDLLPGSVADDVMAILDLGRDEWEHTYADAARRLLAARRRAVRAPTTSGCVA